MSRSASDSERRGLELIAFDGDDTLWHSETLFADVQASLRSLLSPYGPADAVDEALYAAERRNLRLFGYGVKGFTLSMIETAIEVSGGRVPAADIKRLLDAGKDMLAHPVQLIDGVRETLERLADSHPLALVTKGDLFHQETKVARSGLAELFTRVDIVSEKDERTYRRVAEEAGVPPERMLMVGNSLRSDVVPPLRIGAFAAHVPYHVTWSHEEAEVPEEIRGRLHFLDRLAEVPELLERLA